jgi:1,2-phenylacetyl-CoA epoxidase catalytic subunit
MTTTHYTPRFNINQELEHYEAYPIEMAHRIIDRREDLTDDQKQRLHTALNNNWPYTTYRNVY